MALELVKPKLDPEDEIRKHWYARYGRTGGTLVLSTKKLWFVEEKGFITKSYNMVLELPYDKIDTINTTGYYRLEVTDAEGRRHTFTTEYSHFIKENIDNMKQAIPAVAS